MKHLILSIFLLIFNFLNGQNTPLKLLDGYRFTEGPAISPEGLIFFSDVPAWKIHVYDPKTNKAELFMDNTGGANGLYFDAQGNLIACAGKVRKLVLIDSTKKINTLAESFNEKKLNSPNDLWIDKHGGIYFTDPRYGNKDNLEQNGMHVYYLSSGGTLVRVIDDLERPNGIIGSTDGTKLYVVDESARKTYAYEIASDGKLTEKTLFCNEGIDGMSVTAKGDICITTEMAVSVYTPNKELRLKIPFGTQPTNVLYYKQNLYVTTQAGELWSIKCNF